MHDEVENDKILWKGKIFRVEQQSMIPTLITILDNFFLLK